MRILPLAFVVLAVERLPAACAGPPAHARAVPCSEREPESWDIEVAPAGEPGERLVVSGTVYRRRVKGPLVGATVYVYHSDSKGRYSLPGEADSGPRLCGILRSNEWGQYRIRTIMPSSGEGMPHIHFEVWGKGIRRQGLVLSLPTSGASR